MTRKRPFEGMGGNGVEESSCFSSTDSGCLSNVCSGVGSRVGSESRVKEGPADRDIDGGMLLVKELNQLSIEERERALEELHGVARSLDESEDFVEDSLRCMEEEILKIRKRSAYEKALFVSPDRVRDPDFRLMFLRSVFFDPRKAAKRIVNYFHHKLRLFGFDKLVKPITLDGLNEDDVAAMLTGALQILPKKDQAGRTIIVSFHEKHSYKTYENHHRMCWYIAMTALEDVSAQRLGVAAVLYNIDFRSQRQDIDLLLNSTFLSESLPIRYASCHFCYNDITLQPLLSTFQLIVGTEARIRFRAHYGSHLECLYALCSFGLPTGRFPLDDTYNIKSDGMIDFMKTRKENEGTARALEKPQPDGRIDIPLSADIVLGRGRPYQEFPGNVHLAILIDQHRNIYQTIDRLNKTALSTEIVKLVNATGGRFLKKCEDEVIGGWIEVSDDVARDKVSHGFRTKTRRNTAPLSQPALALVFSDALNGIETNHP